MLLRGKKYMKSKSTMEQQKQTKSKPTMEQHDDSSTVCTLLDDSSMGGSSNCRQNLRQRYSTDLREHLFQSSELEDLDDIRLSTHPKRWRDDDAQEGKAEGVGSVAEFLLDQVPTFKRNLIFLSKVSSRSLQVHNTILFSGGSLAVPSDRRHQPRYF